MTHVGFGYSTSVKLHVQQFVLYLFLDNCYLDDYQSVGSFELHKNTVAMRLFKTLSNQFEALRSFAGLI